MTNVLIRGAHVISMDGADLSNCDVAITADTVTQVGSDLDVRADVTIDAAGKLLVPGLFDGGIRLEESVFRGSAAAAWGDEYERGIAPLTALMTPDDVYVATFAGALELLDLGATGVAADLGAFLARDHLDAAVRALRDAGIRASVGVAVTSGRSETASGVSIDARRLAAVRDLHDGRSGIVDARVRAEASPISEPDACRAAIEFARDIGVPISFREFGAGDITVLNRAGMLGADVLAGRAPRVTVDELAALGAVGGFLCVQPEAEINDGRHGFNHVLDAHERGVRITVGSASAAISSPGPLTQMRLLYLMRRYLDGVHERRESQVPMNRRPGKPGVSTRDVLRFGSTNGAAAVGWGDIVGRIAVGQQADLVLINADQFGLVDDDLTAHVVGFATRDEIDTVIVAGRIRKRGGQLVDIDRAEIAAARAATRDRIVRAAGTSGVVTPGIWATWVADEQRSG